MSKYAFFLGCTTPAKVPQYELASRWICRYFDIELIDIEDFVCCGINQVNLSMEAGLLMAAMNLALAEAEGLDILTLCAACTGALAEAIEKLEKETVRKKVNEKLQKINLEYRGDVKVRHISRIFYEDIGTERIKSEVNSVRNSISNGVKRNLFGLRVAPHYGCHYLRPKSAFAGFEEPDNPRTLHQLISATGAYPVEYETLGICCGGKVFPVSEELANSLVQEKLNNLRDENVDAIVLQCQTCYLMYCGQQKEINERDSKHYHLPVLLYPQLLGLALGAHPTKDLGLDRHEIAVDKVLDKIAK
ncbi:MAG: CoB--CoM heterodisulfide reductase iron-sulfur subunit B family protein [Candidatus Aureabacteria bacterium]|nr:CoB--CoM heterodisulfide reductase iron-sulfur subunit B family protein [Candidatus Auribacterota bacterium]